MAVVNNWRYVGTFDDWMRNIEKRLMHEERRPSITSASDLMGPGLGPHAVEVRDWNDDVTLFNGIFYSEPGAINNPDSPDNSKAWIGESEATESGYGVQTLWDYQSGVNPPRMMVRTFTPEGIFGQWAEFSGSGGGGPTPTLAYTFVQASPAAVWTIDHPLTFFPNVTVVDSSGRATEGDVVYTDADTITITFSAAFSGKAYLS